MRYFQKLTIFTLALLMSFGALVLTGCGKSNIELVQNAVFPIDKSRTLAEALSVNMTEIEWKSYKSEQNQQIVEVTGTWKGDRLSRERYVYCCPQNTIIVKFVVNKDQSVEFVDYRARSFVAAFYGLGLDGRESEAYSRDDDCLEILYYIKKQK